MTSTRSLSALMQSCAAAALLALPLGGAALAQSQDGGQTQQQTQDQATQGGSSTSSQMQDGQSQNPAADALIAKVGDAEIYGSDLMSAIGMLPEPLRAQQPDLLGPIALDQLVMRELILQQARSENLGQDPEVQSLVQSSNQTAQEDAMVQIWLKRELESTVTDQQVQQVYDNLSASDAQVPPLEAIRPQIEQHLRQQVVADIRSRLQSGTQVTFYGPNGKPIDRQAQATPQGQGSGGQGSGGQGSDGQPQDTASGSGSGSANDQQAQQNAMRNAQGAGMQDPRVMVGVVVIEGRTPAGDLVHMIVSPSGDLLAVAAPIGTPTGTGSSAQQSSGQDSSGQQQSSAPTPGEPAQSGYMATQTQPATPQMWDPVAVENAMKSLELGRRGVAGQVAPGGQSGGQQGGATRK